MGNIWSQSFFIPAPPFTESNLPDQRGKVYIVTGGYTGIGFELCQILYSKNAKVYITGRNEEKATSAIAAIKAANPSAQGDLVFLHLDLADLSSIKPAVDAFNQKEIRLDVLTNNAGVMIPPQGSKTAQGHELQIGTNCLGPFLLTKLLLPTLQRTAASSSPGVGSVRVIWAGSLAIDFMAPENGVDLSEHDGLPVLSTSIEKTYGMSKAGNVFLAAEAARRYGKHGKHGIISVAFNPGTVKTELQRHCAWYHKAFNWILLYPPIYGAYTQLFSGWSPDITESQNGAYIVPWGRIGTLRPGLAAGIKRNDSKLATAESFWEYCERETIPYS
ncbi:MAG: hypothetical protein LQ351_002444 [Letrouitia transgressa]|nr:MAG: hypothetical protein LQ351_002444 [Letrouitia transgressa]